MSPVLSLGQFEDIVLKRNVTSMTQTGFPVTVLKHFIYLNITRQIFLIHFAHFNKDVTVFTFELLLRNKSFGVMTLSLDSSIWLGHSVSRTLTQISSNRKFYIGS